MERACEQNAEKWDISEDANTLMLTFFCSYFNQFYYFLQLGQETSSFFTSFDCFKNSSMKKACIQLLYRIWKGYISGQMGICLMLLLSPHSKGGV